MDGHAQAEHQDKQMAKRGHALLGVVHILLLEDGFIMFERIGRSIRGHSFGHLLRVQNDAILVGINTARADDPELTVRLPGLEKYSPTRVVLDTRLKLNPESKLVQTARQTSTTLDSGR